MLFGPFPSSGIEGLTVALSELFLVASDGPCLTLGGGAASGLPVLNPAADCARLGGDVLAVRLPATRLRPCQQLLGSSAAQGTPQVGNLGCACFFTKLLKVYNSLSLSVAGGFAVAYLEGIVPQQSSRVNTASRLCLWLEA